MSIQPTPGPLFEPQERAAEQPAPPETGREAFERFHAANPHVYAAFTLYALRLAAKGRRRYSARTIIEVIRWTHDVETTGPEYRINDHYSPYYARLFHADHPEHAGLFETRKAAADEELSP